MNKSKFLKKSLAAILSVLLVVAMIPLSAAAAVVPAVVSRVSVNAVDATEAGNVWTAKINNPGSSNVAVNVTLANDNAVAVVTHEAGKDGSPASSAPNDQGVWTFTMSTAEKTAKEAKFTVWDERGAESGKDYFVKFGLNEGSNDVSIKSITVKEQYGATVVDGDTYTITLPYGTSGAPTFRVELNNANATAENTSASNTPVSAGVYDVTGTVSIADGTSTNKITVKNGETTHIYTVKTVNASAFAKFSVAGERKAAKIEPDATTPKVTVYLPYGSNAKGTTPSFKITPTFTPGYESVKITAKKSNGTFVDFESGKEIDLKDYDGFALTDGDPISGTLTLNVTYSDVGSAETWNVDFDVPDNDPAPVLKELTLDTFKATIDETNHTAVLNVPKSKRDNTSANLKGLASKGATVHLTDVNGVYAQEIKTEGTAVILNADNASTPVRVDFPIATKNNFIIRVTAAGDEDGANPADEGKKLAVQDYKLTINTVDTVGKAEITEMILEDKDDSTKQYKAEIKDNVITFTLPFATTNAKSALDDWKLYYGLSNGTTISSGSITAPSGLELAGTESYLPGTFDGTKCTTPIVVTNGESDTTYNIAIKLADARPGKSLSGVKIGYDKNKHSAGFKFDDMKDGENTFAATGSTDLTVSIPYSKYENFLDGYGAAITGTISDGAGLFYVDENNKLQAVDLLSATKQTGAGLPSIAGPDGESSTNAPVIWNGLKDVSGNVQKLTLIVVNEKGLKNANGSAKVSSGTAESALEPGTFTKYTLIGKRADPQTLHVLDSFAVYDSVTKTKIPAQVDPREHKINLTLPASFVGTKSSATSTNATGLSGAIERNLWIDYGTTHYENVIALAPVGQGTIGSADNFKKLSLDTDGSVKAAASTAVMVATNNGDGTGDLKIAAGSNYSIRAIRVESEAYTVNDKGGFQEYELVVKYDDIKLGCTLNSVTINGHTGTPDSNGKVTITLPKSAELTGLKPTFNVSDGAFVSSAEDYAANGDLIKSGDIMNFTQPKTIWVQSENGANKQKYVIEVKVDDGFSDVKTTDWFYSYVMDASSRGIIIGNPDGTFRPNQNVTRVQFATMMARVDGFNASEWEGKSSQFSDMGSISGEAAAAVAYCADKGYITGDGGSTTFRPNAPITRQEMAAIICRVMHLNTTDVNIVTRFSDDARIAGWAKNYVYACVNANMLQGQGNNIFNPLGNTTRAAAATAAVRVDNAK